MPCIDKAESKIAALKANRIPIYESGIADLVAWNVAAGWLDYSSNLKDGVAEAAVVIIAVATTDMPISRTSTRRRARSPARFADLPSS